MAKNSGGTRNSRVKNFEWSQRDSYEDVLHDAQYIFKKEATEGLGDFMRRKPKKISDTEYAKLLKSGDYIEVFHGGSPENIDTMINGKYFLNKELHLGGFGYYFSFDKDTASKYAPDGNVLQGLIKKSDILGNDKIERWSGDKIEGAEKYIGKEAYFSNGRPVSDSYKKGLFDTTTLAASKGYGVTSAPNSSIVVIDRSALIIRKKR